MSKILVVDDVPDNIKLLTLELEDQDYEVIQAKDGLEALRLAHEARPDLLLLDVMLPGLDGINVCRQLKNDPTTRDIPVLMLSARGMENDVLQGLEAGAHDYITKPFHGPVVVAKVAEALRLKSAHNELETQVRQQSERLLATSLQLQDEIEGRLRAEKHCGEVERSFRHLANAMPEIVWTTGLDGIPDFFNRRWTELTGLDFDAIGSDAWLSMVHPDDRELTLQSWNQAVRTGELYEMSYRLRDTRDGLYHWYLTRGLPVRNMAGRLVGWVGTCTNIDRQKQAEDVLRRSEAELDRLVQGRTTQLVSLNSRLHQEVLERKHAEEALRRSEAEASKLALVASRTDNPVLILDASLRVEWVNPAFSQILGWRPEQVVGQRPEPDRICSWIDPRVIQDATGRLSQGQAFHGEFLVHSATGRKVWISAEILPVRGPDGVLTQFIGIGRDVSEARRDRQRLDTQNATMQVLTESDSVEAALPRVLEAIGTRLDLTFGECWLVPDDSDRLELHSVWRESPKVGQNFEAELRRLRFHRGEGLPGQVWEEGRSIWIPAINQAPRFFRRSGAMADGFQAAFGIPISDKARILGVVAFYTRDIQDADQPLMDVLTLLGRQLGLFLERKRAKRALLVAKEAAEAASRSKSQFLANISHEIRTPLNAILNLTQLTLDSPLQPEQRENLRIATEAAENLRVLISEVLDLSRIDSGRMDIRPAAFEIRPWAEETLRFVAEEARKKGLALAIQIDPNTPTRVVGDADRLRQILLNLLGNAIKFTDRGHVRVEIGPAFTCLPTHDPTIATAPGESRNLPRPGPRISTPVDLIQMEVIDTGIGIADEHLGLIFEPFQQVDGSTTRAHGGVGLGLAICDRLVRLMGGQIQVHSEPGRGSRFRVEIRLTEDHNESPRSQPGPSTPEAPRRPPAPLTLTIQDDAASNVTPVSSCNARPEPSLIATPTHSASPSSPVRLRILVAEDNPMNQRVVSAMLARRGHEVVLAGNGREAIQTACSGPFDLVLMDVQMPEVDGLEATRVIRQAEAAAEPHAGFPQSARHGRLPIFALTAHAFAEDRDRCLAAGMDGYLSKPLRDDKLAIALKAAFDALSGVASPNPTAAPRAEDSEPKPETSAVAAANPALEAASINGGL
jgi:PAS domain S-box-containing protein